MTRLAARIVSRVAGINGADWDACLPGEAECHAYYVACETAADRHAATPIRTGAVVVERDGAVVAVAPLFVLDFRLDTALQGPLRRVGDWAHRLAPGLVTLKVLGVGSPYAERAHIGFHPSLEADGRSNALTAMIEALETHAKAENIGLVAWKDLAPAETAALSPHLLRAGYAPLGSLPVAVLDLPYPDETAYLAALSAATRKDIRRKLARAGDIRIEFRASIIGIEDRIAALYEATRIHSGLDYGDLETLPPDYFREVSVRLGDRALFALYWLGERLIAFNLLLLEESRMIDKFIGMEYPIAREHNLYAVSWMANVRYCLAHSVRQLQTGQTAYAAKLRFGSRLVPSLVYFRHRQPALNWLLRKLSPHLAFDKADPDLKRLAHASESAA